MPADTITGSGAPYTRRRRVERRAAWFAARTRNTLRRPMRIGAFGITAFLVTLVILILTPSELTRRARPLVEAPAQQEWRDTAALLGERQRALVALTAVDSVITQRRELAARPAFVPAPADTLPPALVARRDTLQRSSTELAALLARVEGSPLPATYRQLGESPVLRDDPRVRALLDTLAEIEREREEFGTGAAVDPIFVSLTTQATAIGRSIQEIAEQQQVAIREELVTLRPPPPPAPRVVAVDTAGPLARRDTLQRALDDLRRRLTEARDTNAALNRRRDAAREAANVVAPPVAILASALVLGLTLGFATAFAGEVRRPRVADLHETERETGTRVVAVLHPREIPPERRRRSADRMLPPFLDPTSDAYRLLASHVAVAGARGRVVTVTGDVPAVNAVIGANIAAVIASDARGTLLVDADFSSRAVSGILRIPTDPGVSEVLAGRVDWPAATVAVAVGRDRNLDVVPSGATRRATIRDDEAAQLKRDIARVARRYDAVVLSIPLARAAHVLPAPEAILCAHMGTTELATLKRAVTDLRDAGAKVLGIVMWDADAPVLPEHLAEATGEWEAGSDALEGASAGR